MHIDLKKFFFEEVNSTFVNMFYDATVGASTANSVVTRWMHPREKKGLKYYTQRTHVQIFMFTQL